MFEKHSVGKIDQRAKKNLHFLAAGAGKKLTDFYQPFQKCA
jgi:hypothetical protein